MTAQFKCSLSKEYKYNSILGKLLLKFNPMNMCIYMAEASHVALVVKNPPPNAEDTRDSGSTPGSGRSEGVGSGNPLQYSCLENPMDRRAWWATVHGAPKDQSTTQHMYMAESLHRSPETIKLVNCLYFNIK